MMTYFLALIIFLLPSYLVRFSVFGIPTTMLEVLIYIAFFWTIILKISNNKSQITNPSTLLPRVSSEQVGAGKFQNQNPKRSLIHNLLFIIPIILFIISGIISVVIAPDKREALGLFKGYIVDPIVFFSTVLLIFRNQEVNSNKDDKSQILNSKSKINSNFKNSLEIRNWKLEILIKSLILSGVMVALHAIWQKLTGVTAPDGRILGIFAYDANSSPNYLAFYLAPIAVLINGYEMLLVGDNWKNIHKLYKNIWYYDLAFFLIIVAIWLSGSRAAIGAVIIGIISYFVISYWQKIKSNVFVLLFFCLSVILLLSAGWQQTKPNWSLPNTEGGRVTSSNNIRWEIYKTTVKDILPQNLVWLKGVGLGNYQNYFTQLTKDRVNYPQWISPLAFTPHNLFLNIWVNLGLLGLVSFVWILINFIKLSIINYQLSINNNHITGYWLLVTIMMITILIQGLVDSPIWKNDLVVIFWLLLAMAYVLGEGNDNKNN